jgi:hypothetical protein
MVTRPHGAAEGLTTGISTYSPSPSAQKVSCETSEGSKRQVDVTILPDRICQARPVPHHAPLLAHSKRPSSLPSTV